ncbi:N-acetylmuramoyl-L-alanine amidase family protein [Granulicella arctica]|uniref:N-acetylmuramoyl-L-alanine amidase family protein n=1 Tax=Granulicella arctica TaxID=940613 RepID=UPI0021E02F13|nr:N-acetylmuramoyl-L-alanine amidase [Granulicella arctica]
MTPTRQIRRLTLTLLLGVATGLAQTAPATPYMNRNLIVLDPAHGNQDSGATINNQPEKEITLAFATTLKTLLTAKGFTVVSTREAELPAVLTTDQRAGTANHLRPVACIVLHATSTGDGVHIFTSSLPATSDPYEPAAQISWESAQTTYLAQSQHLANDLGLALVRTKVPAVLIRTALRPLDNLTCPAVAIELAPLKNGNHRPADEAYQQRVADTLAAALLTWRDLINPRPAPKAAPTPAAGATP